MKSSRRALLAAAGSMGLASIAADATAGQAAPHGTDQAIADLLQRSAVANAALMRGDIGTYRELITIARDFTLMSPFGGTPSRGPYSPQRWEQIGALFRNGRLRQELVQAYGSADMVVLVVIEHAHVEVGGLAAQDWPLRVTLVYQRDGTGWCLAHRHADPLVAEVSLDQAAALARGERP